MAKSKFVCDVSDFYTLRGFVDVYNMHGGIDGFCVKFLHVVLQVLREIDEHTDIVYNVVAEAGGGMVASR